MNNFTLHIPPDKRRDFQVLASGQDHKMTHLLLGFIDIFLAWRGMPRARGDFLSLVRDRADSYRMDMRLRQGNRTPTVREGVVPTTVRETSPTAATAPASSKPRPSGRG